MSYDRKLLDDYTEFTRSTAKYDPNDAFEYVLFGLGSEVGEVQGKYKKFIRDNTGWEDLVTDLTKELGDVMWYVTRIADEFGIDLVDVIEGNILKLQDRKDRDVIGGSGDYR